MNQEFIREVEHELLGVRVKDQAEGRVGKLCAVYQYVNASTDRVMREEAHLRPVDGSGWEWTARVADLAPADDPAAKARR